MELLLQGVDVVWMLRMQRGSAPFKLAATKAVFTFMNTGDAPAIFSFKYCAIKSVKTCV
jgi:hypothetical protein